MGKPIDIPHIPNPTQEDIDKYHKLYCDALTELFDKYKEKYAKDRKSNLRFVQ